MTPIWPTANASLNALALFLLIWGLVKIKNGDRLGHERIMKLAFTASAAFLACYLYYHFNYSSNKFLGTGLIRPVYYIVLISHIVLSVVVLPFIFRLLFLAKQQQFARHKSLGRWVWPIWVYNSASGLFVYFMLYHVYGGPS